MSCLQRFDFRNYQSLTLTIKRSMLWSEKPDTSWNKCIKFLQGLVGGRLILVFELSNCVREKFGNAEAVAVITGLAVTVDVGLGVVDVEILVVGLSTADDEAVTVGLGTVDDEAVTEGLNVVDAGIGFGIVDVEDEEIVVCIVVVVRAVFAVIDEVWWSGAWVLNNDWRS